MVCSVRRQREKMELQQRRRSERREHEDVRVTQCPCARGWIRSLPRRVLRDRGEPPGSSLRAPKPPSLRSLATSQALLLALILATPHGRARNAPVLAFVSGQRPGALEPVAARGLRRHSTNRWPGLRTARK